ncbi:MAG: diguanylate cyclase [Erythrobacter sp.]|nr:MAG: diguanylate cyclase [Erythrobacter sp.]
MLAISGLALPGPARAQEAHFAPGSVCHTVAASGEELEELARQAGRWNCNPDAWPSEGQRIVVRLDQRLAQAPADYISMRRQRFDVLEVQSVAADGSRVSNRLGPDDLTDGETFWEAFVPVPQLGSPATAIILAIDNPNFPGRMRDVAAVSGPPFEKVAGLSHLFAALLCGLLLAPVFFDLGFARTLRQRFPLYHGLFCFLAAVNTATVTGVTQLVWTIDPHLLPALSTLSFDLMVAASTLFLMSFIEPGIFSRTDRRVAQALPVLAIGLGLTMYLGPAVFGAGAIQAYYAGYLLFVIMLLVLMGRAWRNGSRAIRFIVLAYTPLILVGLMRIFSTLFGPINAPIEGLWQQCLALAFEVVVTSFAVADRFMTIKRERDSARSTARVMEELSERDPLTGLLNRRALEARFAGLRAEGFTALAAIDLDHFKAVNDRFGHAAGDEVLRCVGKVLRSRDDQMRAFRMGGEEFVLLLRGDHALARAEELRLAIAAAVENCAAVPITVTASMGVVEAPADAWPDAGFLSLYEHADRLLYEAKENGRNCTASERLKVFRPHRKADRRKNDRRVAA